MAGQREAANGSRPASHLASSVASQPANQPTTTTTAAAARTPPTTTTKSVMICPHAVLKRLEMVDSPPEPKPATEPEPGPSRAELSFLPLWCENCKIQLENSTRNAFFI